MRFAQWNNLTIFVPMVTVYCTSLEESLKLARKSARTPGRHYGGITLPSGRKGFAVYEGGRVVEQYSHCDVKMGK